MATGSWTGTTPRGVYKPQMNEKEGNATVGAWKDFDTSLANIHNKLWAYNWRVCGQDYATLNAAVTAISTTECTLVIMDNQTLTVNTTIPSTLHLQFFKGGKITLGAYTLTINGTLNAPLAQIFDDSGAGSVTLGPGPRHPEWWGAVSDATADATQQAINVTAFQSMLDQQGEMSCAAEAIYRLNARVRMMSHTVLEGKGKTRIVWTHNTVGIDFYQNDDLGAIYLARIEGVEIRNISLEGANNGYTAQTAGNHAIQLGKNTDPGLAAVNSTNTFGRVSFEGVAFYNWGDCGIYSYGGTYSLKIHNCRFTNVYDGVNLATGYGGLGSTGTSVAFCIFDFVGNDCLYANTDDTTIFGPGNVTEKNIKGYYTHFESSMNPWVSGNRLEGTDQVFHHLWNNVEAGYLNGGDLDNIHLDGASRLNKIIARHYNASWGGASPNTPVCVYEDTANGAKENDITILTDAYAWRDGYGCSDTNVKSRITTIGPGEANLTRIQKFTADGNIEYGGYIEVDCNGGNVALALPQAWHRPFSFYHITLTDGTGGNCTITPNATYDGIDGGANGATIVLRNQGDFILLKPRTNYAAYGGQNYETLLARHWASFGRRLSGSFTCANHTDTVVADTNVRETSIITLMPTNDAAGTVQGSTKHLVISARTSVTSFTVSTADGVAAAGTETFEYVIQ